MLLSKRELINTLDILITTHFKTLTRQDQFTKDEVNRSVEAIRLYQTLKNNIIAN